MIRKQSAKVHVGVGKILQEWPNLSFQKSEIVIMLILFLNVKGVVHQEFVPPGETVNA